MFMAVAFLATANAAASSTYQDPVFTGPSISAFYSELHSIDSKYNMQSAWEAFETRDVVDNAFLELWYKFYWETYMYDVESLQLKYTGVEELAFSMDPEYTTLPADVVASLQAEDDRLHESIRNVLQGPSPTAARLDVDPGILVNDPGILEMESILDDDFVSYLDLETSSLLNVGYPSFLDVGVVSYLESVSLGTELELASEAQSGLSKSLGKSSGESLAAKLSQKLENLKLSSALGSSASSESTTNGIAGTWAGPYLAGGVVGMVALAVL